ncbi:hypothetical protein Y032_0030g2025 [Ancylostoma ceylanicum]|uniref:CCHC-type domain-containing protein n=1 Tax=Ancylostoma ceylanicum TaxID=53326 RepID=A0A016UQC1_9BILA|nr:hypothetical protein Y032_0030g2025 [Ancylostoma ceylanicum]
MSCEEIDNEGMLLQTSENFQVNEGENSSKQLKTMNPKVGFIEKKSKELVKVVNKNISAIVVECEKALGLSLRTTDPIRNAVMESVERHAKVAKEATKVLLEQFVWECEEHTRNMRGDERDDIEEGVIEILRVAGLTQTNQLELCLDEKMSDRDSLQRLSEMVGCLSGDLVERVRELLEGSSKKERENERLRKTITQQDAHIQELMSRIAQLCKQPAAENALNGSHSSGLSSCSNEKWKRFSRAGTMESCANQQKLQGTSTPETWNRPSCSSLSQSSSANGIKCSALTGVYNPHPSKVSKGFEESGRECDNALLEYMRTAALPVIEPFHGGENQSFRRFVNAFLIRYHKPQWDDVSLIQLFESFLREKALVTFETLPKEVKEGSFEGVVDAMQERLQEDGNSARVKALSQLRCLSLREGQSVAEFCVILEKIAHKAFPDTPAEVVSLQKAEILFRQLASWNGSYSLSEAIETSSSGDAYENVKRAAMRLERNRRAAAEMSSESWRNEASSGRIADDRFLRFNDISRGSSTPTSRGRNTACIRRNMKHHAEEEEAEQASNCVDSGPVKCYNCGRRGHIAKECRMHENNANYHMDSACHPESFSALVDKLVGSLTVDKGHGRTRQSKILQKGPQTIRGKSRPRDDRGTKLEGMNFRGSSNAHTENGANPLHDGLFRSCKGRKCNALGASKFKEHGTPSVKASKSHHQKSVQYNLNAEPWTKAHNASTGSKIPQEGLTPRKFKNNKRRKRDVEPKHTCCRAATFSSPTCAERNAVIVFHICPGSKGWHVSSELSHEPVNGIQRYKQKKRAHSYRNNHTCRKFQLNRAPDENHNGNIRLSEKSTTSWSRKKLRLW